MESFLQACRQLGVPEVSRGLLRPAPAGADCTPFRRARRSLHLAGVSLHPPLPPCVFQGSQLVAHARPPSLTHTRTNPSAAICSVPCRRLVNTCVFACAQCCLTLCSLHPPQVTLCSASDVVRGHTQGLLRLLLVLPGLAPGRMAAPVPAAPLSEHLLGFGVFYASLMLLLYLGYRRLCGF